MKRNKERADRVIRFIENLTIPSGVGAGGPFLLRPFQVKFIRDVYEPVGDDGSRLVREAVDSMARKNGKTALIAALVLVHLIGPEAVTNGEVYSAANDKEQAGIVFKFATQLLRADDELMQYVRIVDSSKRITVPGNGSFYRALSRDSKTKHGLNPTFAIYDELAQSLDRELYDTLNTSDGARDEFLFAVISTQSKDPQHILSELIDRGLRGDDPTIVCHLHAVPDDIADQEYCRECEQRFTRDKDAAPGCTTCGSTTVAGPYDPTVWVMANPALGDFLLMKAMRKAAEQAMASPSFENSFFNLRLNMRVDSQPSLINARDWRACLVPESHLEEGEDIYLGIDLSATTDLTAVAAVSAEDGDQVDAWFWKPRELFAEHETRDRAPYTRWEKEGHLFAAPGRDVDYDLVALHIAMLDQRYNIIGVAYDRWRIDQLMKCFTRLEIPAYYAKSDDEGAKIIGDEDGIRFVQWGQGYKDMGPAVDALDSAVAARTLAHAGHPVLTWNVSNAVVTKDSAGNRKLDKTKARFRIDGAVATTMALGLKARDQLREDLDWTDFLRNPVTAA